MIIHEYFFKQSKISEACLSKQNFCFPKDEKWKRTFFLQNFLKALMKYDG